MDKIKEKLLEDFKRANKKRKITLANRYGFSTPEEYLDSLESKEVVKPLTKPTIHNVILLDATGSMSSGGKYNVSMKGIKKELEWLKTQEEANYTETIEEFIEESRIGEIRTHKICKLLSPSKIDLNFVGPIGDNTPLYKAVLDIIESISTTVPSNEKVLLKVYTDGGNNRLDNYKRTCADKIRQVQKENFTVTFVGTKLDLSIIINDLNLESSNCLEIENTGAGFEKAFERSMQATQSYTKAVVKGEDVSVGFYKKIVK